MKIAFLDRDGTINRDYPDEVWSKITEPEILDGSIEGMKYILENGYKIIIITNQYTIGEGFITLEQYESFQKKLLNMLRDNGIHVLDTFFCPHGRMDNCGCCKPKTGLIEQALKKYPDIDLAESFMCGDSVSDRLCAESMELRFFGIKTGEVCIENLAEVRNYI